VDAFSGSTVLVTGGAGFVGSNLVQALVDAGAARVDIVDNLLSAERTRILELPAVHFAEGSIADDDVLTSLEDRHDYVFHLATYHGNQSSIHDPLADHANNTLTTLKLFEALHHSSRVQRVVYASAGCTVAEKSVHVARATAEDAPVSLYHDSPYQVSKIIGELYGNYYWKEHGLPVVKARFQNVYGPGEILGAGRWRGTPATVWRNVVPTFIYRGLTGLPLTLDDTGLATRDFIFVSDIVLGLMLCASRGHPGEVYNLASGVETSIRELAETTRALTGKRSSIEYGPARSWDHSIKRFGSTSKSREALGFSANVILTEGLRRTVEWTKGSLSEIETAIGRHRAQLASIAPQQRVADLAPPITK
jgi:nucleoside-diphosphate-sugar epimerase